MSTYAHCKQIEMLMLGKSKFVLKPHGNDFFMEQCIGKIDS
jgi:hypothetical protein